LPEKNIDFTYYKPVNKNQEEFHSSAARHKLLIGGVGGGKTYPAVHEAIFHCLDNPGHSFLCGRNTWDRLEEGLMDDIIRVCTDAGCIKENKQTKRELILINNCRIMFRPLTIGQEGFKGMHLCGFLIDDPDVVKYSEDISFLFTRLRNPPNVYASRFQSIITSNWEGRNWLWKIYMREREQGGDDRFAYWVCPTNENPTLHENYISDLAAIHSEEWMDRYVYCKNNTRVGLVYPDFDPAIHNFHYETIRERTDLIKIMAIDVGMVHPTVVLKLATDGSVIWVYDEWMRKGIKISELGGYLQEQVRKEHFHKIIIDPSSARGDQITGSNPKHELQKNFGLPTFPADNAVTDGIGIVRDLLKPASGPSRLYMDLGRCQGLHRELDIYRWKEPRDMDFDAMSFKEEPVKKNDDAVDTLRYGVVYLRKFLKGLRSCDFLADKVEAHRVERMQKLKHYDLYPALRTKDRLKKTYQKLGFSDTKINQLLTKTSDN